MAQKTPPQVFDFNTVSVDKVQFQMKKKSDIKSDAKSEVSCYGPVLYQQKPLRIQTPYMRTPRGLIESDFKGKTEYYFELSLLPSDFFENCLPKNSQNVSNIRDFITTFECANRQYLLENYDVFVAPEPKGDVADNENEAHSDVSMDLSESLGKWQRSLIKESTDGYPAKFNFRMTKEIKDGEYAAGVVLEQEFNHEDKNFTFKKIKIDTANGESQTKNVIKTELSTIAKIKKHAQVRFQLLAEQCYFIYDRKEPENSSFGVKWAIEQILFINSSEQKEPIFTSCNFEDIEQLDTEPETKFNPMLSVFSVEGESNPMNNTESLNVGTKRKLAL